LENTEENCEMKGRKVSWKVKRYEKYGKKASCIEKWYGKYGRFLC
jgi:hypothetical protein